MEEIHRVAKLLYVSKYVIALTGAGISAESGIPTFRGKNGLWRKYRPEELATFQAFIRNPKLVWEWYAWRISMVLNAKPNPAHKALSKMEQMGILKAIITQNVDNLHERAGSKNIVKLHGDILKVRCIGCRYEKKLNEPPTEIPPRCPECGSLLRPGVVWFGEPIPPQALRETQIHMEKADTIIVIGTSGVVYPAAAIPYIIRERGGKVIEINISQTAITPITDYSLQGKAGEILPLIVKALEKLGY